MMNLKHLFKTPLQQVLIPKWIPIVFIVIAFIGFADATFLTIEHFGNRIPPCTTDGCETVLTSAFATIGGIPVALMGAIYYLALLILLLLYLDVKKEVFLRIAFLLATLGFIASIYFFILQAFVIHAFCQYCIISGLTSTLLFIISIFTFKKYKAPVQLI